MYSRGLSDAATPFRSKQPEDRNENRRDHPYCRRRGIRSGSHQSLRAGWRRPATTRHGWPTATRRAAKYGNGWLPQQIVAHFDLDWFERKSALFREELEQERPGFQPRLLLRIGGDFEQLVKSMPGLAPRLEEAGVTDVVIDVNWSAEDGGRRALAMAREVGF